MKSDVVFILEALKEAEKAYRYGEVPIGAVIVKDNQIIGRGFNRKEFLQKPTAHAEIIAIEEASRKLNSWRLNDCTLYSTVEPCIMCCGAIIQARVKKVVYSVPDPKFGGIESLFSTLSHPKANHQVETVKIYIPEVETLMKDFFKNLREKKMGIISNR
ncbi:nucleoside deaminase [Desulfurobacterium indicum]|uniref:tRNA-specific adenosine deaminase n=1 Tax=Desulfurobacterium indicum TaxID=1914305 RepID=A0A1R1ML41_9BACT|nr:nucleoside deaminase [Desulfurobacterium indicum]OMH40414.1 tRNA-specific adenosine deaminase [Desulfurobacterium indicum]